MEVHRSIVVPESMLFDIYSLILRLEAENTQKDMKVLIRSIKSQIETKMGKLKARELYSTYKSSCDPVLREKARKEYLDFIGMSEDWRY